MNFVRVKSKRNINLPRVNQLRSNVKENVKLTLIVAILLMNIAGFSQPQRIGRSNAYWEIVNSTTLKITGSGNIPDFLNNEAPWALFSSVLTSLEIGDSITRIGDYAFFNCYSFTGGLTIPSKVISVGNNAFRNCRGFTGNLVLPIGLTSIGDYAFSNCKGFTGSLAIPSGLTSIGNNAFDDCNGFSGNLTLPSGLVSIGNNAFTNCSGFTGGLVFPSTLVFIGNNVFYNCSSFTGSLIIPSEVTFIGDNAFTNCSGFSGDLILSSGLTSIGNNVFYNCSGFTGTLTLSSELTSIGNNAFYNCSGFTGDLTIPSEVISIGYNAFYNCYGFNGTLTLPSELTLIGNSAFYDCGSFTGDLTIPPGVVFIGNNAFDGCIGFAGRLTLPSRLMSIGPFAFRNCYGINEIINLNPTPVQIDEGVFVGINTNTCTLKVSSSSLEAYREADVWKDFLNIIGEGFIVTALSNNISWGKVTSSVLNRFVSPGESVTFVATPAQEMNFINWTSNGAVLSANLSLTITITQDTVIIGNFESPETNVESITDEREKVVLYPNPVKDQLYIQSSFPVEEVMIYAMDGRRINRLRNVQSMIDMDNLAKGIYLVRIKTIEKTTTHKIVKK